jgi:enamine deaminase RidA (YjgF/YER057c/UK114 family)
MTTTLQELYQLCNSGVSVRASQDELDELGLLLDRLEEVEIYLDSTLTTSQRKDALAEFDTLTDRINLLVEKV